MQRIFYSYCAQRCTLFPYALMAELVPTLWVISNAPAIELKIINIEKIQCVLTQWKKDEVKLQKKQFFVFKESWRPTIVSSFWLFDSFEELRPIEVIFLLSKEICGQFVMFSLLFVSYVLLLSGKITMTY